MEFLLLAIAKIVLLKMILLNLWQQSSRKRLHYALAKHNYFFKLIFMIKSVRNEENAYFPNQSESFKFGFGKVP